MSMMTRKHYHHIAKILKQFYAHKSLIEHLADYLETTNPNFDRDRFLRASGVPLP